MVGTEEQTLQKKGKRKGEDSPAMIQKDIGQDKIGYSIIPFLLPCPALFCFDLICYVLYWSVLICYVLYCSVLLDSILPCFALLCFLSHCIVLNCIALHCSVLLYSVVQDHTVHHDILQQPLEGTQIVIGPWHALE